MGFKFLNSIQKLHFFTFSKHAFKNKITFDKKITNMSFLVKIITQKSCNCRYLVLLNLGIYII